MPLTPTPGSDALAAGMDLVPGSAQASDLDEYINKALDYIAQRTNAVQPIAKGGTGATTAATARTALGIPAITPGNTSAPNALPTYNGSNQLTTADPSLGGHAASKQYVDSAVAGVSLPSSPTFNNVTATGHIFVPNSSVATSGWTSAYINGDGRISRGASALKYKKFVSAVDPATLGGIFPQFVRYQMRGGDGSWQLGYIADDLEGTDAERFVVRIDGEIESIDFIQMLIAQVANLHARLEALEAS